MKNGRPPVLLLHKIADDKLRIYFAWTLNKCFHCGFLHLLCSFRIPTVLGISCLESVTMEINVVTSMILPQSRSKSLRSTFV